VNCEIARALDQTRQRLHLPLWLDHWGTAVTLTITVEDQTGLSPGISLIKPLQNIIIPFSTGGNVMSPQSFSLSIGGTASVNALRTETIQYTIKNDDLLKLSTCANVGSGVLIDGDLKIREFIYDNAQVLASDAGSWGKKPPQRKSPLSRRTAELLRLHGSSPVFPLIRAPISSLPSGPIQMISS
jgi:hypothetical protein